MENKYYTPTIEEFHVGFEFERDNLPCIVSDNMYFGYMNLEQMHKDGEPVNYFKHSVPDSIRVKYLDKEDIESLGWKFKREFDRNLVYKGSHPTKQEYEFGNIWNAGGKSGFLDFFPETSELSIITTDNGFNADGPNNSIKFKGTIKNKSELTKLMQQLNIK